MSNDNQAKRNSKRLGAGRKFGSGLYSEVTTVIRIPVSQKPVIQEWMQEYSRNKRVNQLKENLDPVEFFEVPEIDPLVISLPLYESKVPAGLPSTVDGQIEQMLNPCEYLLTQDGSSFFVTIQGDSMIEVGLFPGDKAVVDNGKKAVVGDIVLARVDGEFTIKILGSQQGGSPQLLPANSSGQYTPTLITELMQFEICGVVTGSLRRFT